MNTTNFFQSLRDSLNELDQRILLESINQDKLIQNQICKSGFFEQCVDEFGPKINKWSLAKIACFSLGIKPDLLHKEVNEKFYLKKAISYLDDNLKNQIGEMDFIKAAYLAFALFERKRKNQSWSGLIEELSVRQQRKNVLSNWRTSLAILFSLLDFDEKFLLGLVNEDDPYLGISFVNHIIATQFMSNHEKSKRLIAVMEQFSIDVQIVWLQSIPLQLSILQGDVVSVLNQSASFNKKLKEDLDNSAGDKKSVFDETYRVNLLNGFKFLIENSPVQSKSHFQIAKKKIANTLRFIDLNLAAESFTQLKEDLTSYLNDPLFNDLAYSNSEKLGFDTDNNFGKTQLGMISTLKQAIEIQKNGDSLKAKEVATRYFTPWMEKIKTSWTTPEYFSFLTKLDHKEIINSLNLLGLKALSSEYVIFIYSLPLTGLNIKDKYIDALETRNLIGEAYQELKTLTIIGENQKETYKKIFHLLTKSENWSSLSAEWEEYSKIHQLTHEEWIEYAHSSINADKLNEAQTILLKMDEIGIEKLQIDLLRGKLLFKQGNLEQAKILLEETTRQIPGYVDGWLVLSEIYLEIGNSQKSMEILRTAVLAVPDSDVIHFKLGKVCIDQELFAESLPYLRKAYALNSDKSLYALYLVQTLQALGRTDEADVILGQARMKWPQDAELAYKDALRQIEKQNRDLALTAFEVVINANPSTISTFRLKQYIQVLLGDHPDKFLPTDGKYNSINNLLVSQKYIQNILKEETEESHYFDILLGEIYYLTGELETANSFYTKILTDLKENPQQDYLIWRAYAGFGLVKIAINEIDSGIAALEEASQLKPNHLGIKQKCAESYITANLISKAEIKAEEIYELGSTLVDNLVWYSDFMRKIGKYENEMKGLEQILHFDPQNPYACVQLANIYIANGKIDDAYETLLKLESVEDLSLEHTRSGIISFLRMGRPEKALSWFHKTPVSSNDLELKLRLYEEIYLLLLNEKWEQALAEIQTLKKRVANSLLISSLEGYCLFNLGDFGASVNAYETALILPKDNLNKIVEELIEHSLIPEYWIIKKIDELSIHTYLTKAYNYLNEYDHSLEVINRMVRINPKNLWIYIWGAENAIQLTDYDLATDYLVLLKKQIKEGEWQGTEIYATALDYSCAYLDGRKYKLTIKESDVTSSLSSILSAHLWLDQQRFQEAQDLYNQVMQEYMDENKTIENSNHDEFTELKESIANRMLVLLSWRLYDFKSVANFLGYQSDNDIVNKGSVEEQYLRLSIDLSYEKILPVLELLEISEHSSDLIAAEVKDRPKLNQYVENIKNVGNTKALKNLIEVYEILKGENSSNSLSLLNSKTLPEYLNFILVDELVRSGNVNDVEEYIKGNSRNSLELIIFLMNHKKLEEEVIESLINSSIFDDPLWLMICSHIAILSGRKDEAIDYAEKGINIWPEESSWLVKLARLYQSVGELDKAETLWMAIIDREKQPDQFIFELSKLLIENNKSKDAIALLDQFSTKINKSIDIHLLKADAYSKENLLAGLENEIQFAKGFNQKHLEIDYLEANAFFLAGKIQLASTKIQELLVKDQTFEKAHILQAKILRSNGKFNDAIKRINKSLEVCPQSKDLLIEKIRNLRLINENSEALLLASELSQKYPADLEILALLANSYKEIEDYQAAEKVARKSLHINPNQPAIHLLLGYLAKFQGNLDQALDHFSKAILINESEIEPWIEMGEIYLEQNEHEKALGAYKEACSRNNTNPLPYYKSGLLLRDMKDYQNAEKMLRIASELSPKDTSIRRHLAAVVALNLVHSS